MINPFAHAAPFRATATRRPNARLVAATLPTLGEGVIGPLRVSVPGSLRSWLRLLPVLPISLVAPPARPASPLPTRQSRPKAAAAERLAPTPCASPPAPDMFPTRKGTRPDRAPSRAGPTLPILPAITPAGPDPAFPARCGTRYSFAGARGAPPATPLPPRRRPRRARPPHRQPPTPVAPGLEPPALPASGRGPGFRCGYRSASR